MTEDEAKSKWCPYKKETEFGSDRCVGSSCMMFRKSTVVDERMVPQRISDEFGELIGLKYTKKEVCWCGLAVKP